MIEDRPKQRLIFFNMKRNMINRESFNRQIDGKQVGIYTLRNAHGMSADITNYGAKIVTLFAPDKENRFADVVLGFNTLDEWIEKETYFNAVIGRFANRIKDGKFVLDGRSYELAVNNGTNHLHGGNVGFNQKVWDVEEVTASSLRLHYFSCDGEENYPGNLDVYVTYAITDDNSLTIHYEATTDAPTIVGFTNHAYFNLKGEGCGDVRDHVLQVNADLFTQVDDSFAPDGVVLSVEGHPMDFRKPTQVAERIDSAFFAPGRGIDNNWVLRKSQQGECVLAAVVEAAERTMEVYTTMPGLQVYTGNWVEQHCGKSGQCYDVQHAICLETQGFPNSPNQPHFPSPVLREGEKYDEWTIYRFV